VPADSALFSITIVGHYVLETLQNAKIVARKGMTHALFQNSWFLVFCDFNRAATGFGVSVWLAGSASSGERKASRWQPGSVPVEGNKQSGGGAGRGA
jgi:hypothetical protein